MKLFIYIGNKCEKWRLASSQKGILE